MTLRDVPHLHHTFLLVAMLLPVHVNVVAFAEEAPTTTLTGTVYDADGEMLNAEVHAYRLQAVDGRATFRPECVVHTDHEGRYNCTKIPAGTYVIGFRPDDRAAQAVHSPLVFYPSGGHLSSAEKIVMRPGEFSTIDLHAANSSTGTIEMRSPASGNLHYDLFMSADGARLQVSTQCGRSSSPSACIFEALPPGDYQIEMQTEHDGRSQKSFQSLALTPYAHLFVSAGEPSSVRVMGAISSADELNATEPNLELRGFDCEEIYSKIVIDKEGGFSVSDVQSGAYALRVHTGSDAYVCGTESGGTSHDGEIVSIPPRVGVWKVNVNLCTRPGTITGQVSATDLKVPVRVALISTQNGIGHETDTTAGRFSFTGLAPGNYVIASWDKARVVAYANPSVQERLLQLGFQVTIERPGDMENVEAPFLEGLTPLL